MKSHVLFWTGKCGGKIEERRTRLKRHDPRVLDQFAFLVQETFWSEYIRVLERVRIVMNSIDEGHDHGPLKEQKTRNFYLWWYSIASDSRWKSGNHKGTLCLVSVDDAYFWNRETANVHVSAGHPFKANWSNGHVAPDLPHAGFSER